MLLEDLSTLRGTKHDHLRPFARGRTVRFAEEMLKHARSVVLERNAASIVKYRAREALKEIR